MLLPLMLTSTAHAVERDQYKINPGDILEISVWGEEKLNKELRVLPDGSISFPLAGTLAIAGKSINAVQKELTQRLTQNLNEPEVNVAVKAVEGNMVYVIGQVNKPGNFIMYQPMDVMQILSLAGGLTTFAKTNDILVLRRSDKGPIAIRFKYGELEDGDNLDGNHRLQSGDVVVVP